MVFLHLESFIIYCTFPSPISSSSLEQKLWEFNHLNLSLSRSLTAPVFLFEKHLVIQQSFFF